MNNIAETIHTSGGSDTNGMGFFMGMIVLVLLVLFFIFYGLPYLRGGASNGGTQKPAPQAPAEGGDGGSINVPDKIDINVNQPK